MTQKLRYEEDQVVYSSKDGVPVYGTLHFPIDKTKGSAVLVHGLNESRDEAYGYYSKLAFALSEVGLSSLRFDLRGHGASSVACKDLTLLNSLSDIDMSVQFASQRSGQSQVHLVGTSFGGGLCALYAALNSHRLSSLTLLCPNLDYYRNWISKKSYWSGASLNNEGVRLLVEKGYLKHGNFDIGPSMLHELLHIKPYVFMPHITAPTLTVHGTADSVVPPDLSIAHYKINGTSKLLLIEGADHGFTIPDDESFSSPKTISNLNLVFDSVKEWMLKYQGRSL